MVLVRVVLAVKVGQDRAAAEARVADLAKVVLDRAVLVREALVVKEAPVKAARAALEVRVRVDREAPVALAVQAVREVLEGWVEKLTKRLNPA